MGKQNYIFCLDGSFLEHPSLVEVKSKSSDDEWDMIVKDTVDAYATLQSIFLIGEMIDKKDLKILKSVKKTIDTIRKLDPLILTKYDPDSLAAQNVSIMKITSDAMKNSSSTIIKAKSI